MQNLYEPNPDANEPLFSVGTITAAASAILALVAAFGLHLTDAQEKAVIGVIAVAAPIVVALWGRRRVYAPATVARLLRR